MSRSVWALLPGCLLLMSACVTPSIPETRTLESARHTLQQNRDKINWIYIDHQDKKPDLEGVLLLRLSIDPGGHVVQNEIVQTKISDREFIAAVMAEVSKIEFGSVRQPGNLSVTYLFNFQLRSVVPPPPVRPRRIHR